MFSFPTFIRKTPSDSLRAYLAEQHRSETTEIDWPGDKREIQAAVLSFIKQLPREGREAVYADFEQVQQLCDQFGQLALRSMVLGDLEAFDALEANEARGLSVLVSNPTGFKHALSIAYSERFYNGRSWSHYHVSQPEQPSVGPDAMAAFEADLKDLFTEFDGSGRKTMVEHFERPGELGPTMMYSIYVESPPQSIIEFDESGPQRKTRRPVIEAVVCYDPAMGTLDIVAKGGKPTRKTIGEAFVAHLLSSETELLPVSPREFDLDRLRRPMVFATDPVDGIKQVSVTALRLRDLTEWRAA